FQGGLHQQLRTQPRDLLQDLRQRAAVSEQLIDVVTDTVGRRYSDRHGRGSFLRRLAGLEGNLRPSFIYTGSWTRPTAALAVRTAIWLRDEEARTHRLPGI